MQRLSWQRDLNAESSSRTACETTGSDGHASGTTTETLIPVTSNSISSGSNDSSLRFVNVAMGCPELQISFDSAAPGSSTPFRSFTLTKGTGYAYVQLHFSKLWVPRGTSVMLRAVEGFDVADSQLNLSTTYLSSKTYSDILTPPVLSKELRLDFYRNEGSRNTTDSDLTEDGFNVTDSKSKCYGFVVDSYYYVLVDDANPLVATVESVCAADNTKEAVCFYDDTTSRPAYLAARSVARLFITKGSNIFASCTGWLLGNQGHIMTNHHCVATDTEASSATVEFMVEASKCNGTASCTWKECRGNMVSVTTKLVRANEALDYALLKLPSNGAEIAQTYGYLRLKTRDGVVGEQVYIPQHPLGNRKRIALVDDYTSKVALLSLSASSCGTTGYSYSGDTQSGSSGSPVVSYSDHGVVALHHCGDMCGNTGIPAKNIVADLKANGIDVALFDGIDDGSSPTANFERLPAYSPPVAAVVLPLKSRLKLDGAIVLANGFVSTDKLEFTLAKDTDVVFDVFSVEMADNDTFIDLNGDCRASYMDAIIYLFPKGDSTPVFFADDSSVDASIKDGSVSFRDPYKRTFLKKGSYILAIAPTGSSEEDALAGKFKAEYPPEIYTCRARGSYGSPASVRFSVLFAWPAGHASPPPTDTNFVHADVLQLAQVAGARAVPDEINAAGPFVQIRRFPGQEVATVTVNTAELPATQRWEVADALVSALSRANVQSLTVLAALHLPYAKDTGLNVFYSGLNVEAAEEQQVDVAALPMADPAWEVKEPWLAALLHLLKVEQWPRTHLLLAKGYKPGRDLSGTYEAADALAKALQLFTKDKVTVDLQEVQRELPKMLAKEKVASTASDDHLTLLYH
ncbi:unnamed protein product [Phytophthora lilii]|uniref:Unnamed protein product n=1 Tax=Phytophthora lilii TaxID=2077276 RepID=A0A9W6U7H1_9STRA|nr:unnamed protein product [Phytophthora lilii]